MSSDNTNSKSKSCNALDNAYKMYMYESIDLCGTYMNHFVDFTSYATELLVHVCFFSSSSRGCRTSKSAERK